MNATDNSIIKCDICQQSEASIWEPDYSDARTDGGPANIKHIRYCNHCYKESRNAYYQNKELLDETI